ncbi:MAG TPA: flagellar biosynthetic protein FliR [Pyrinomonadaceae bacterium]|jgi:flagellar biosynthetic protein FliR
MNDALSILGIVLRVFEVGTSPRTFLLLVGLSFARMVSFLGVVPFFGGAAVPARVKAATAVAFVVVVFPSLAAGAPAGDPGVGVVEFVALLAKETFVGFTLGFVASLVFEAIQVSGRIIDAQRGSTMSETFAPELQTRVSELGQFKLQFAVVLFLLFGLHHYFIGALLRSFEVIPLTAFPNLSAGWSPAAADIVRLTGEVLTISVRLAAPVIVALLLTDLFFGLVNRVAPQINVFFLSMPVKMLVGLLAVLVALPIYKELYLRYFGEAYKVFEHVIRTLGGPR